MDLLISTNGGEVLISEILMTGRNNAQTAAVLSERLNLPKRAVMRAVEQERNAGAPICASPSV